MIKATVVGDDRVKQFLESRSAEAQKKLNAKKLNEMAEFRNEAKVAQQFVNKIVGTQGLYDTNQIGDYLRNVIISRLNNTLGQTMTTLLDLTAQSGAERHPCRATRARSGSAPAPPAPRSWCCHPRRHNREGNSARACHHYRRCTSGTRWQSA